MIPDLLALFLFAGSVIFGLIAIQCRIDRLEAQIERTELGECVCSGWWGKRPGEKFRAPRVFRCPAHPHRKPVVPNDDREPPAGGLGA